VNVVGIGVGPLETNCWIVSDGRGGPAIVIDPGEDLHLIEAALDGADVAAVVLTHAHFDHLGAAGALVEATGAPLLAHAEDAHRLTSAEPAGTGGALFGFDDVAPAADRVLEEGDVIEAGAVSLRVLHTPGHTRGGISLYAEDPAGGPAHLFSGDTLFAGSVGRSDFPGGDARELARSIAEKLAPLPADTLVHPGHGPDTTIGREARINPFWPRG
jgi:glyoxylase-like metal-dependent hydrolase (beta-lactamase superfamily II)